jgi:hypothetical protein
MLQNFFFWAVGSIEIEVNMFRYDLYGWARQANDVPGNTKGGRIPLPLTSCLTGLD